MTRTPSLPRAAGFTLVEILVGLTLGLIAIIVMLQVFSVFDSQKRSTTSGSDAQTTGLISLYSLEREIRMAGYGLVYNNPVTDTTYEGQLACNWMRYSDATSGTATADRVLPVLIEDGAGNNGSDRITVMFATTPFAPAPSILSVAVNQASDLVVRNAPVNDLGANAVFAADDIILVGTPQTITAASGDNTCTLLRVTGVTPTGTDATLARGLATSAALPPVGATVNANLTKPDSANYSYDAATSAPTIVLKLGSVAAGQTPFIRNHYAISAGSELQVRNLATNAAAVSIGDNVIDMQAQYGVVAATCADNAASCNVVNTWVNATGATWAAPSAANMARIKAIRVSIVTRSSLREREPATNNCLPFDGTTNVPTGAAPCRAWANDANAPQLPWTGTSDWTDNGRFFRYRTYETIIPLRNMLWGNT
jgi:type IV pilus assembly protein PilW